MMKPDEPQSIRRSGVLQNFAATSTNLAGHGGENAVIS
jgi:hypothetical protein